LVFSDSSTPERSTGTAACAPASTSRASGGGRVSSGGPPEEFRTFKNAFTPRERRGSAATSKVFSGCTAVVPFMASPFLGFRGSGLAGGRDSPPSGSSATAPCLPCLVAPHYRG